MYDFLCVFPHANASHSLTHYLSQHPQVFASTYTSIYRSLDDIFAHERHLRPWISNVGIVTKDYHDPDIARKISDSVSRRHALLTVRDPVGSVVAQRNNSLFLNGFSKALNRPFNLETVEEHIQDAIKRYVTPTAAEDAYDLRSYEQYRIVDIDELKGANAAKTVSSIWAQLGADISLPELAGAKFPPLGSRGYTQLRGLPLVGQIANAEIQFFAKPDDELWLGYYDAKKNLYSGREQTIHTFENSSDVLPSFKLAVPLHISVYEAQWASVHPHIRQGLARKVVPGFINHLRILDSAYAFGETHMTFTVESFTPLQRDILASGIEDDFSTFLRRHPEVAERWTVTRSFLGI